MPKLTIDELLRSPRRVEHAIEMAEQEHFTTEVFGLRGPVRRRFDPRRLTDRLRKPPPPAVTGGAVVYSAATTDELYSADDRLSGRAPEATRRR